MGKKQNSSANDEKIERGRKKMVNDHTEIFNAVASNELETVKKLLSISPSSYINIFDNYEDTLLSKACRLGFYDIVLFLLDNGATEEGLSKCYGSSYLFKVTENPKFEIFLELSYRGFLGERRLKKIGNTHYEIGF
jgi:ankyrin repeat protein